jgi:uncharacterized membrane protein
MPDRLWEVTLCVRDNQLSKGRGMAKKYSFLVIKYPKRETGSLAVIAVKRLDQQGVIKLRDAVAITKTDKGKIKLEQTKDDTIGTGLIKGGVIGVLFAALFGPVGWIAMGAAAGGLFASFDRGIKNKLLKELGGGMTPSESALAILVEHADWQTAVERMKLHHFEGELVVSEIVAEDLAEAEQALADPKTVIPEELEIAAPVATAAVAAAVVETVAQPTPEPEPVVPAAASAAAVVPAVTPEVAPTIPHRAIKDIEGIGPAYAEKLAAIGIHSADELLEAGAKPSGRAKIAKDADISEKLVLEWVDTADLMRVPGVGPQYSDLLEAAGVDSPAELAHRNPAHLAETFQEVVAARPGTVRRIPTEADVAAWIEAAGKLDKVVEH